MTDPYAKTCDEVRLNLYLDGELGVNEAAWMEAHLKDCSACRRQATTIMAFTHAFQRRVQDAADTIDFVALEKQVIRKTLPRYILKSAFSSFLASMKYYVPATLIAGFLLFFIYTHYIAKPMPVPSAIINSFTGSVSSVMIFETPETRETILWYNEKMDMESEQDAV
jgi:predicted anti-sigma-YlaC factor YlaD